MSFTKIVGEAAAAGLAALWTKELVSIPLTLLLAPACGMRCHYVSLFGLTFSRSKDERQWQRSFRELSPLCQTNVVVDLDKTPPEDTVRRDRLFSLLRCSIMLVLAGLTLAAVLLCGCGSRMAGGSASRIDELLVFYAGFLCFHCLVSFGIFLYTQLVLMKRLGGYVQSLVTQLRQGRSFSEMGMQPLAELPYPSSTSTEKLLYYQFWLSYLLECGRIGEMQAPTVWIREYLYDRSFIVQETWGYYWLVFYYSYYEPDPDLATHFLFAVRSMLETDPDANAKRVLAYYAYGIERDLTKARTLLTEAFDAVERFSVGAERELERRLLLELSTLLDRGDGQINITIGASQ